MAEPTEVELKLLNEHMEAKRGDRECLTCRFYWVTNQIRSNNLFGEVQGFCRFGPPSAYWNGAREVYMFPQMPKNEFCFQHVKNV